MHGYDIYDGFFQNGKINGPYVEGSGPKVGPIWLYTSIENVLILHPSC